ncbi:hypothetical protein CC1G_07973 [Coprinopsis cinerea okayama7|uniref:Uncharacterized protein n=1 Tax=Coprinopsis cinerea (strain Okayama-7 / 130 / ATCC MYA-4618 / FGSC 9003) TaxID=240176 RepID=A8P231_COPC7|nr:hypothetical protein CC1G_07973 [Coprinopsis cinerea okayama7\|eukprot:XP_001838232.2 hypothetical protein CC1G_07973 [Coprinopsis cinerea okayama7\
MPAGTPMHPGIPKDVVAIFHTSFHPTKGNVLDWCLKAPGWEDLQTDNLGLEFSALPSGLHQLDEDIVHFTSCIKPSSTASSSTSKPPDPPKLLHALSLFRRRRTPNPTYRGFLLSALGILVVPSYPDCSGQRGVKKPRPWRHVEALRAVAERCYSRPGSDPSATPETGKLVDVDAAAEEWYEPARIFLADYGVASPNFRDYLAQDDDASEPTPSDSAVLDDLRIEIAVSNAADRQHIPTLQLPSLLTLLGPSSVTLFRHLLARKRIMVFTNVPVGPACTMCYAMVDMVRAVQSNDPTDDDVTISPRHSAPVRVLGMLTLNDLVSETKSGLLEDKIEEGRGWVACTTDALFLEKPQYYDLLIDLTALSTYSTLSSSASSSGLYSTTSRSSSSPSSGPSLDSNGKKPSNLASNRPRPTFYVSKLSSSSGSRPSYKLSQTRWAWSDVRLWSEIDRVLRTVQSDLPAHVISPHCQVCNPKSEPSVTVLQSSLSSGSSSSGSSTSTTKPKKRKGKSKSRERNRDRRASSSGVPSSPRPQHQHHRHSLSVAPPREGSEGSQLGRIPAIPTSLVDAWKVYEDVCLVCAGVWMGALCSRAGAAGAPVVGSATQSSGSTTRSTSAPCCVPPRPTSPLTLPPEIDGSGGLVPSSTTGVQLDGDDDILLRTVRGAPGKAREVSTSTANTAASDKTLVTANHLEVKFDGEAENTTSASGSTTTNWSTEIMITLGLLYTLERYARWQIGVLHAYVRSLVVARRMEPVSNKDVLLDEDGNMGLKLTLTPRDVVLLDLNPLSSGDVRYLEALVREYAGQVVVKVEVDTPEDQQVQSDEEEVTTLQEDSGRQQQGTSTTRSRGGQKDVNIDLVVKRGWRDLVGVVFGFV